MKQVLLVTDVSAERVKGGAERMLVNHLRALGEANISCAVLTRQPEVDAPLFYKLENGVTEYRLPFSGDRGVKGLYELLAGARRWWMQHCHLFDRVIIEQPFTAWALLRAGCRLPQLQVCYSFAFEEYRTRYGLSWSWKHALVATVMRKLEGWVYRRADHILVLSDYTAERLRVCFNIHESVLIVAGGVDLSRCATDREELRRHLGWQGPVVVTLRNMVPRTGVDLLIQTAAIMKHSHPDLRWVVMGDGALRQHLEALAEALGVAELIEFTGFLSEKAVQIRMSAADAFMLPTRSLEGFGLVTLEANCAGLPVVATPVGANPQVVASLPGNHLAASIAPEALAKATEALLFESENRREDVAKDLIESVASSYRWELHDRAFVDQVTALCR